MNQVIGNLLKTVRSKIDEKVNRMNEVESRLNNKKKALSNAYKELEMVTNQLQDMSETLPMLEEEYLINLSNGEVVLENFELLKPNWKYETDPRYIANLKKLAEMNVKKIKLMHVKKLAEYKDATERLESQKEQIQPYIDTIKEEIKTLEAELGEKNE